MSEQLKAEKEELTEYLASIASPEFAQYTEAQMKCEVLSMEKGLLPPIIVLLQNIESAVGHMEGWNIDVSDISVVSQLKSSVHTSVVLCKMLLEHIGNRQEKLGEKMAYLALLSGGYKVVDTDGNELSFKDATNPNAKTKIVPKCQCQCKCTSEPEKEKTETNS